MSLLGNRVESIRLELLNRQDQSLGNLEGVVGGSLDWNANAILPGGGTVQLDDLGQVINFSQDRIRPWYRVASGTDFTEWPLGVFVMAAPSSVHTAAGSSRVITLIDKLTVVKDDTLTQTLQFPAGANIVQSAVSVLQSSGETRIAFTDNTATLTNPMSWEPGISKLQAINDLLSAAGYWGLWTDRTGQFRMEPYINPSDRPVTWSFEEGDTAIHLPEWSYELPLWAATNRVVMISQANDLGVVMVASATDDNPDSPTSTVSMGRVLNPIVEENVEASSLLDLQQQANRKLLNNSNTVGQLSVSHAPVPVWYNEAIFFKSQGMETKATITKMSLTLAAGELVQAEWRQS